MKPNKGFSTLDLVLIGLVAALSIATKPYVKSAAGLLTGPLQIPAGTLAGTAYMFWPVLVGYFVPSRGAVAVFCLVQGVLAVLMGFGGRLGPVTIISYLIPGVLIEFTYFAMGLRDRCANRRIPWAAVAAGLGNGAGSAINSVIFFGSNPGIVIGLIVPSALTGALGGIIAVLAGRQLSKILRWPVPGVERK